MDRSDVLPLDLERTSYAYVERYNPGLIDLANVHVLAPAAREGRAARVLDIGCGCGANAMALKESVPGTYVVGIEPSARAAELASARADDVFRGTFEDWARAGGSPAAFDGLLLSDVLEHIADPVAFLRSLSSVPAVAGATWIISVPNFAVWYNRVRAALGIQRYSWSGLWDRTHLRFYTRRSLRELLEYAGLRVVDEASTPSLVQSMAPVLRRFFDRDVSAGDHLALTESPAYKLYRSLVEPTETRLCSLWPELLAFQIVVAARRAA